MGFCGRAISWYCAVVARQQKAHYFPPRHSSCVDKFGKCRFFHVCALKEEHRERMLGVDFIVDPWDWTKTKTPVRATA